MVASEIDGYIYTFTNKLQQVIHDVGKKIIGNGIKPQSSPRYARRLIWCVNRK